MLYEGGRLVLADTEKDVLDLLVHDRHGKAVIPGEGGIERHQVHTLHLYAISHSENVSVEVLLQTADHVGRAVEVLQPIESG